MLNILIAIAGLIILYCFMMTATMLIVAHNDGSLFYTSRDKKWNVWFGEKSTSTKIDVLKFKGNIFSCFTYSIVYLIRKKFK